jgi:predicted small secreted protein
MRTLLFILTLSAAILAGCSADTITGPGEEERALEQAEGSCSINTRLC